jgi:hypothetical protein
MTRNFIGKLNIRVRVRAPFLHQKSGLLSNINQQEPHTPEHIVSENGNQLIFNRVGDGGEVQRGSRKFANRIHFSGIRIEAN